MANLHTLSSVGLMTNGNEIIQHLFKTFLEIDYMQSNLYRGNVSSYREIFKEDKNNVERMSDSVKETLTNMYSRYFEEVKIEVNYSSVSDGIYQLIITGTMEESDGSILNLNKDLTIDDKVLID